jgi:DNA-binding transcriptional ArsR family regulator
MENPDDESLERVGRYFAALSVPMRLKILDALRDGQRNVGEIARAARCTQANASKHLSLLAHNGLVARAQQGTAVYYRCAEPSVYELYDRVREHFGR